MSEPLSPPDSSAMANSSEPVPPAAEPPAAEPLTPNALVFRWLVGCHAAWGAAFPLISRWDIEDIAGAAMGLADLVLAVRWCVADAAAKQRPVPRWWIPLVAFFTPIGFVVHFLRTRTLGRALLGMLLMLGAFLLLVLLSGIVAALVELLFILFDW